MLNTCTCIYICVCACACVRARRHASVCVYIRLTKVGLTDNIKSLVEM